MLAVPNMNEILKTENFVTWLGEQPPDKVYNYIDPEVCAVTQYLQSQGLPYCSSEQLERGLGWHHIVLPSTFSRYSTFGEAYIRGRGGYFKHYIKKLFGR